MEFGQRQVVIDDKAEGGASAVNLEIWDTVRIYRERRFIYRGVYGVPSGLNFGAL